MAPEEGREGRQRRVVILVGKQRVAQGVVGRGGIAALGSTCVEEVPVPIEVLTAQHEGDREAERQRAEGRQQRFPGGAHRFGKAVGQQAEQGSCHTLAWPVDAQVGAARQRFQVVEQVAVEADGASDTERAECGAVEGWQASQGVGPQRGEPALLDRVEHALEFAPARFAVAAKASAPEVVGGELRHTASRRFSCR